MLASTPAIEMAETLRVLAGVNAGNAARHFTQRSADMGDVAGAILWSSIGELLEPPPLPEVERAEPPIPQRMKLLLEVEAFRGMRFEDVDDDLLIDERLQEILEAEKELPAGNVHRMPEPPRPPAEDAEPRASSLALAA